MNATIDAVEFAVTPDCRFVVYTQKDGILGRFKKLEHARDMHTNLTARLPEWHPSMLEDNSNALEINASIPYVFQAVPTVMGWAYYPANV